MAACTTSSLTVPSAATAHLAGLEPPGSFSQLVDHGHGGPTALEELVSHLSLRGNKDWSHGNAPWKSVHQSSDSSLAARGHPQQLHNRRSLSDALQPHSSEEPTEEGEEGQEEPGSEGEEKHQRMRDKNRRAQQRFRQRQKAKLQAKELETYHLQKQVQELQAQLAAMQVRGGMPEVQLTLGRLQAQNQALQLENLELRALATRLLEENTALQSEGVRQAAPSASPLRQQQQQQPAGHDRLGMLAEMNPTRGAQTMADTVARMPTLQRESVFSSIRQVPWQRMSSQMELGLPVGANPGSTGAAILLKRLNRQDNGSSTTLLQFPPGFVHDYIITTDTHFEEGFILAGSLTDMAFKRTFKPGDYACVTPGQLHGPYLADPVEGCLLFCVTRAAAPLLRRPEPRA